MPAAVSARGLAQGHVRPARAIGSVTTSSTTSSAWTVDLHRALVVSCDTVFYRLAHQAWIDQGISAPAGRSTPSPARSFGLGRATEWTSQKRSEQIPDRAWKRSTGRRRAGDLRGPRTGYPQLARTDKERAAYLTRLAKRTAPAASSTGPATRSTSRSARATWPSPRCRWPWSSRPSPMGTLWQPQVAAGSFWHRGHEIPLIASAASRGRVGSAVLRRARERDATGWLSRVGLRRLPPGSVRRRPGTS